MSAQRVVKPGQVARVEQDEAESGQRSTDRYAKRVIVQQGDDEVTTRAVQNLKDKHGENTTVVRAGRGGELEGLDEIARTNGKVKVQVVGHGDEEGGTLGDANARKLAQQIEQVKGRLGEEAEVSKVALVGCKTACGTEDQPSLKQQVQAELAKQGTEVGEVKGRDDYVKVDAGGSKAATTVSNSDALPKTRGQASNLDKAPLSELKADYETANDVPGEFAFGTPVLASLKGYSTAPETLNQRTDIKVVYRLDQRSPEELLQHDGFSPYSKSALGPADAKLHGKAYCVGECLGSALQPNGTKKILSPNTVYSDLQAPANAFGDKGRWHIYKLETEGIPMVRYVDNIDTPNNPGAFKIYAHPDTYDNSHSISAEDYVYFKSPGNVRVGHDLPGRAAHRASYGEAYVIGNTPPSKIQYGGTGAKPMEGWAPIVVSENDIALTLDDSRATVKRIKAGEAEEAVRQSNPFHYTQVGMSGL
ncbi:hypothetical protein CFB82_41405 [Burkholderia sp. HI2714]|nr:hypothetical protein CFB82_41405 [Burkholderia sp. HI2714]